MTAATEAIEQADIPAFATPAALQAQDCLPPFPRRVVALGVLLPMMLLVWVSWSVIEAERRYQESLNQVTQGTRLLSTLTHLDEVLSMSAVVGAWTNDTAWEGRYRENLNRFQTALGDALLLAPSDEQAGIAALAQAIAQRPVDEETKVFELIREGRVGEARHALDAGEYHRLKESSRSALANFRMALTNVLNRARTQAHDAIAPVQMTAGLGVVAALLIWAGLVRHVLGWRDRVRRSYDDRLAQAEEHFVTYIRDFSRSMAAMTESLTHSARLLRANCQDMLESTSHATASTPQAPAGRATRRAPVLRVITNDHATGP